jgi:hypothetical protein
MRKSAVEVVLRRSATIPRIGDFGCSVLGEA